uniref:Uncharacterized protein n=1 Tax=Syphacia muris TaxID=451379 RepID=A0A0N5ABJ7_9BILA
MSSGPFVIRGILINGKGDGQTMSPRRLPEIVTTASLISKYSKFKIASITSLISLIWHYYYFLLVLKAAANVFLKLSLLRLGNDDEEIINLNEAITENLLSPNHSELDDEVTSEDIPPDNDDDRAVDSPSEMDNVEWIPVSSSSNCSIDSSYMSYSMDRSTSSSNNQTSSRPATPLSPTVFRSDGSFPL